MTPLENASPGATRHLLTRWFWATVTSAALSFAIFYTLGLPYILVNIFLPQPESSPTGWVWRAGCAAGLGVLCGLPIRFAHQWWLPVTYRPILRRLWLNLLGWIAVCAVLLVLGTQRQIELYAELAANHEIPGTLSPHPSRDWLFTDLLVLFIADTLVSGLVLWWYRSAAKPPIRY
jgi:hypothetical protein